MSDENKKILVAAAITAIVTLGIGYLFTNVTKDAETADTAAIERVCEQIVDERLSRALSMDSGKTVAQEVGEVKTAVNGLTVGQATIVTKLDLLMQGVAINAGLAE